MTELLKAKPYEELEEGELICFVGVHILKWERYKRDYGIPNFDFAFVEVEEEPEPFEDNQSLKKEA